MAEVQDAGAAAPPPSRRRRRGRAGLWLIASLLLLVAGVGVAGLVLTGRSVHLPVWAVAEVEARLNRALEPVAGEGTALSIGGIDVAVGRDWIPRLRLEDLRLLQPGGDTLLTLPEARIVFDPEAILRARVRVESVTLVGASVVMRRLADGRFDLTLGNAANGVQIDSFAGLMASLDRLLAGPAAESLRWVESEAMTLTLEDQRARRTWQVGDGRLRLDNRPDELAAELGFTLLGRAGKAPATALLTFITAKGKPETRVTATVDHVAAADIAAQALPIAFLGVLDAAISGRLSAGLDATGRLTTLEATLAMEDGALRPTPETQPIAFERAGLAFTYDAVAERIDLTELTVESASLRLAGKGHTYLPGVSSGVPQALLTQMQFTDLRVDPAGLFERPVRFSQGAVDLRMTLAPFSVDIGQVSLVEDGRRLIAKGRVAADPEGWRVALDVALNEIAHDNLLALWPVTLVPRTRNWLVDNVQEGQLFDVKAALRLEPKAEPRLSLGYEFAGVDVRFLKTLPPIKQGHGYSTIEGNRYTLVLDSGYVTPAEGGPIDVARSVFSVRDITQRPARAEVRLKSKSSLTAALSLLDEPPFQFLTKAGQPVTLGSGTAEIDSVLRLPLKPKVTVQEVDYTVTGRIRDLRSEVLVPGRVLTAPELALSADATGLRVSGAGKLGEAPFDVTYAQGFGPRAKGRARIDGLVTLSQAVVEEFGLGLPKGMISGEGRGQIGIELEKGNPPRLRLVSDLNRIGLAIPEIGWTKSRDRTGRLEVEARLGPTPAIDRLALEGGGLEAEGQVTLKPGGGGLDAAEFSRVRLNGWFDSPVTLTGRGKGRAVAVAVNGGTVDLRRMSLGKSGGGARDGGPLTVRLDRLTVSAGIQLNAFRGEFTPRGGFNGSFTARVNGQAPVQGTVVPTKAGSAVRIKSEDAGGVLASSGIFPNARGGALDLQLAPTGRTGHYNGRAEITDVRLRNAPVLAELLSAISVVGILEQLRGTGLVFNEAEADFRLTPDAIEITRGAAVGASLGVSMAGVYGVAGRSLNMQGVVSPIYLLNGIGSVLTRPGEGLFGFSYTLGGTADDPQVSVNPLSILTPGMFREIFRRPTPVLPRDGAGG